VTAATCKVAGEYQIYCECGKLITVEGLKIAHQWDTVYNKNKDNGRLGAGDMDYSYYPATCTTNGQTAGKVCYNCGHIEIASELLPATKTDKPIKANNIRTDWNKVEDGVVVAKGHFKKDKTANTNDDVAGVATPVPANDTPATCVDYATKYYHYNCCDQVVIDIIGDEEDEEAPNFDKLHVYNKQGVSSEVGYRPATCYRAGTHAYKTCYECGLVTVDFSACTIVDTEKGIYSCGLTAAEHVEAQLKNDAVLPKLEHDWDMSFEYKAEKETCWTNGRTSYYKCKNAGCEERLGYDVIPAHGTAYWVDLEEAVGINGLPLDAGQHKLATCTEPSVPAGKYCNKEQCMWDKESANDNDYTNFKTKVKPATNAHDPEDSDYKVVEKAFVNYLMQEDDPSTDADESKLPVKPYVVVDCTVDAYVIVECVHCHESFLAERTPAKEAHDFKHTATHVKPGYKNNDGVFVVMACLGDEFKVRFCNNCEQVTDYELVKAQAAHYYVDDKTGEKVTIDPTCTEIEKFHGKQCAVCGYTVNANIAWNVEAPDKTIAPAHDLAKGGVDATCTTVGFEITRCNDCGKEFERVALPAINPFHKIGTNVVWVDANGDPILDKDGNVQYKNYVETLWVNHYTANKNVPASYTSAGYDEYVCNFCGETVKYYHTDAHEGAWLVTYVAPETVAHNGGKLAVNVLISGNEFAFNTIKFNIHTAGGLALAAENVKVDYPFADDANVQVTAKNNGNYVSVAVVVPADVATGAAKDVEIHGDFLPFVTVYFDVLEYANNATVTRIIVDDVNSTEVHKAQTEWDQVTDADEDDTNGITSPKDAFKATVAATNLVNVPVAMGGCGFMTAGIGDSNLDGEHDAQDLANIESAIYAASTSTLLDINKNGVVDLNDYVAFLNYYVSDQTFADYLKFQGVDYMAYVDAYTNLNDLDKNGEVNADDKAVLAYYLELNLAKLNADDAVDINVIINHLVKELIKDGKVEDGEFYSNRQA
jgi:hypothetical protein